MTPFIWLAGAGFLLSLAAHLVSLTGHPLPSSVMALHVGIFVVWLPTVVVVLRMKRGSDRQAWKTAFAGAPTWMKRVVVLIFVYSMVSFFWFVLRTPPHGAPLSDGDPAMVRGFSGHWMTFYSVAFTALYSARRLGPQA